MLNQIEKVLPRSAWDTVVIKESNEPLAEVLASEKLKLGLIEKQYQSSFLVRKSVAEKLENASRSLPKNLVLILIEGYRSLEHQQESWDRKFAKLQKENPDWTPEQIETKVKLVVAKPNPFANHHCGGAVDVALAHSDGTLVDMGTPYPNEALSAEWYKKFQMLSEEITEKQKANRKILRDTMEIEGFVWYPGEWWHYCYGDRMWAVYSGNMECRYGPIDA